MSVKLAYISQVTVQESITVSAPDVVAPTVTHKTFNTTLNLSATSTPPVSKTASFAKALSAGAATIDLTNLTGTVGTVDGTGTKVQSAKFLNPSTNANAITVKAGASNAYLLGGTSWSFILSPGMEITVYGNNATPSIDATHKNIDLAGTGTQALNVVLVMG